MDNLIQESERKFRQNLTDGDLEQMMPILLPGVDPGLFCYREVAFRILLQQELLRSIRYSNYVTLVLLKLDQNEDASEKLDKIVSMIRRRIRTTDLVGQFDGNRVLGIVLLNAPEGPAELVAGRLRDELAMFLKDPGFLNDPTRVISVVCPVDANSWDGLLESAANKLR